MGKLLGLFTDAFGGGWALLSYALVFGAVFYGGFATRGYIDQIPILTAQKDAATCKAAHEKGRADANAAVVAAVSAQTDRLRDQLDQLAKADRVRAASNADFLRKLKDVPSTTACASSPAFRLLVDRMRNDATGVAAGSQ